MIIGLIVSIGLTYTIMPDLLGHAPKSVMLFILAFIDLAGRKRIILKNQGFFG